MIVAIVLAAAGSISTAAAQVYPSRSITIVVPFAAGGPTDVIARALAQHARESLGQPVIIENVAGANGNIGAGRVHGQEPPGSGTVNLME